MRVQAFDEAVILYSEPLVDFPGGEPALLVHEDRGGCLIISQEGRDLILDPSLVRMLRDELSVRLRRAKEGGAK